MRLTRRMNKAEAAMSVKCDENSHEGMARWTARFRHADPRHRAIIDEIYRRSDRHTPGVFCRRDPPAHAGLCMMSMVYQLNLTGERDYWYDPTARVADWRKARRVLTEFMNLLTEYYEDSGDVFPVFGYGLEGFVDKKFHLAWGPTIWEIASDFPDERRAGAALPDFFMGFAAPEDEARYDAWARSHRGGIVVSLNPSGQGQFTRHAANCITPWHPLHAPKRAQSCRLCCDNEEQMAAGLKRLGLEPGGLLDCPTCRGGPLYP